MELKEVFEPIISFMRNFQKKDKEKDISKQAAKDRLKLVLMQDRASVSPDFFEMMKKEIIDVIKKYIEIDEESLEVELTRGFEAGLEGPALYANIPIKNIKPVASNGEESDISAKDLEKLSDVIVDEILSEAEEKIESVTATIEKKDEVIVSKPDVSITITELKSEEEPDKPVLEGIEDIAKNVAKEMKKTAKTTTKTTSSKVAKKATTKKAVKKVSAE